MNPANNTIKVKCPFDGAVLTVNYFPGIEAKALRCPACKKVFPFTQFKRVMPTNEPPERTQVGLATNNTLGTLTLLGPNLTYQLKPGRNIIGRKSIQSTANFQIDTGEKRSMSREHIVIEVKNCPTKGFVHYISLFKEQVNKTYVGQVQLLYNDCLVLKNGDFIRLPDATLKFDIRDIEDTDYRL